MFSIYTIVFGLIFNGRYGEIPNETATDYALGIFLSLTIFRFIAEILNQSPSLIVNQPNFVKKVVFPIEILPIATVGSAIYHFLISMLLVFIATAIWGHGFTVNMLWFPIILIPLFMFVLGLSWLFSSLSVYLRDIAKLMESISIIIMYSSAVFFSTSKIEEHSALLWNILKFNPIIHFIDLSRATLLWGQHPNITPLIYIYASSILTLLFGYWCFKKLKPGFADVL